MQIKKKHGGAQEESKSIKYYADKWCKDNGYPTTWSEIKGGRPRKK